MNKKIVIGIILSFILGIFVIFIKEQISLPDINEDILLIAGTLFFLIVVYFIFKAKRIFLYLFLGLILMFFSYLIATHAFLNKYHFVKTVLLLVSKFLATLFLVIAAYRGGKELIKRIKE
jgi:hypothetical protein